MFVHQNSLVMVHLRTDPKVWCVNKSVNKEIDTKWKCKLNSSFYLGFIKQVWKFFSIMNRNGHPSAKFWAIENHKCILFWKYKGRTGSDDMLEFFTYL